MIKVKLSLCFNWAPRHEGVLGEWRYSSTHSFSSALDGGKWSASRLDRFTPKERAPVTHWIGGWVGPRAVLVHKLINFVLRFTNSVSNSYVLILKTRGKQIYHAIKTSGGVEM
jgi:hypothetical protein